MKNIIITAEDGVVTITVDNQVHDFLASDLYFHHSIENDDSQLSLYNKMINTLENPLVNMVFQSGNSDTVTIDDIPVSDAANAAQVLRSLFA